MDTNYELQAKEMSFWTLMNENSIVIPDIQRDYAQGRKDDEIGRIRSGLIRDIIKAVRDKTVLNLNFIYGRLCDKEFIPIDGQQRLTTLFLFHWYAARQSGKFNYVCGRLKEFKYSTRNTSSRFCEYLCAPVSDTHDEYDFKQNKISLQILDKSWFTGAFEHDPTILSMLTVLDSIHSELKDNDEVIKNIYDNFISEQENCYVKFLLLPLEGYSDKATEDLYIKMNSRGKLLTDFEIFKGRLQDSIAMRKYAESLLTASEIAVNEKVNEKIISLISIINNDYSELFYKFADKCKEYIKDDAKGNVDGFIEPLIVFDKLLMKFFNEFCRYEHFISVQEEKSIANETQRTKIKDFTELSVSDLWDRIGDYYDSISRIFKLLHILYEYGDYIIQSESKGYFNCKILLNVLNSTYKNNTYRYLSYCYLIERGCIDEDFDCFKRFIYNVVENAGDNNFGKNADVSFRLARFVLKHIDFKKGINNEIANLIPPFSLTVEIDQQIEEEKEKAFLILSSEEWKTAIMNAEKYYIDGQIDFLLKLSNNEGQYDLASFQAFFDLSKMLFDARKCIQRSLDSILFRKALLYMEDNTTDKMAYLLPSNTSKDSCWSFIKSDFKELLRGSVTKNISEKRQLLFALMKELKNFNPQNSNHVNLALKSIIERNTRTFTDDEAWKNIFLDDNNDLFRSKWWGNSEKCFHKTKNGIILLLTKLKTSSQNWDVKTYILAKLRNEEDKLSKVCVKDLKTKEEINRYLSSGIYRITYDYNDKKYYVSKNNSEWKSMELDEILTLNRRNI